MDSHKIIISLVIFAAFVSIGYSALLKCVRCESHEMKGCLNDGMNATAITNFTKACDDASENVCMKVVAKATRIGWTGKNGKREIATIKVSRFCAQVDKPATEGCTSMEGAAGYLTYCTCKGHGCNGGANVVGSIVLLVSCFIAKIVL